MEDYTELESGERRTTKWIVSKLAICLVVTGLALFVAGLSAAIYGQRIIHEARVVSAPRTTVVGKPVWLSRLLPTLTKTPEKSYVKIFSGDELYLDANLTLPGVNVYIVAPRIYIADTWYVNLKGRDAPPTEFGENGGYLVLYGQWNGSIVVDVSGGRGGDGLDGEPGEDGVPDLIYLIPLGDQPAEYLAKGQGALSCFTYEGVEDKLGVNYTKHSVFVNEACGQPGGRGGNAGQGGYSGDVWASWQPNVTAIARDGKDGVPGRGGAGGAGVEAVWLTMWINDDERKFIRGPLNTTHLKRTRDGRPGADGSVNRKEYKPYTVVVKVVEEWEEMFKTMFPIKF